MKETSHNIQTDVVDKIQECLRELGFEPEKKLSDHEGIVFAQKEIHGKCIRFVAHITDRESKTTVGGPANLEVARDRVTQIAIRPTLSAQIATRSPKEQNSQKNGCE